MLDVLFFFFFFFFKQKTAYEISECDWSSDVCSSDLAGQPPRPDGRPGGHSPPANRSPPCRSREPRSEERRVGKERRIGCRSRWSPYHHKKKTDGCLPRRIEGRPLPHRLGRPEDSWIPALSSVRFDIFVWRFTVVFVFFFKQKTAYEISECDWSSDVCASDLMIRRPPRFLNVTGVQTCALPIFQNVTGVQ